MLLVIDVGNTNTVLGLYDGDQLVHDWRIRTVSEHTVDEYGMLIFNLYQSSRIKTKEIKAITGIIISCVVPPMLNILEPLCKKYFNVNPLIVGPGIKTGMPIFYDNPKEVGADRIANAIAAMHFYPNKNLIVVDFGTATTFCVISKKKEYLGGIILPGVKISMEALESKTAQLPIVEIKKTDAVIGKSTVESIQSGLYHGQIGIVRELKAKIIQEAFADEPPIVLATGGFSRLFEDENLFKEIIPTLALQGLYFAYMMNQKQKKEE